MTTVAQLRKAALALPEVEQGSDRDRFLVRGKRFAAAVDGVAELHMSDEDARTSMADIPAAEPFSLSGKPVGIRVALTEVNGMQLNALVRRAWAARAPKRLVTAAEQAESGADGAGDLPPAIGKPALRALLGAGITSMADVASRTDDELLALHGVGPKAIKILAEHRRQP
ncbi:hypothetical protein ACQBAU_01245 [Propionibacteriaceae bacterium Y2011]|uniref:hypothetical protein n=1 Tax=Microlunatus sp. Y2014 TaxID=3418488 RepID=UPI003B48F244